jgi:hypothetical protein
MVWSLALTALIALLGQSARGAALTSHIVRSTPATSDSLIVGRAVCHGRVWLLNEHLDLTEITSATLATATHAVTGFHRDERPWGLACNADQTIWTLPGARTMARITSAGKVVDRRPLNVPITALFGIGDRLLLAPAPPVVGFPLLASTVPDRPDERRAWPGLLGRAAASRVDLFARNLVACGIGFDRELPCWLTDATEVVVSNGVQVRRMSMSFAGTADIDREAPIRDVALVDTTRAWVLTTSARMVNGRRAGRRLLFVAGQRPLAELVLPLSSRLIVAADATRCVLLTVDGQLIEVNAP